MLFKADIAAVSPWEYITTSTGQRKGIFTYSNNNYIFFYCLTIIIIANACRSVPFRCINSSG